MLVLSQLPWLFQLSDSDRVTSLLLVSILVLFALFPSVLHLRLPLFLLCPKSATGTSFRHTGKRKCCLLLLSPYQEMLLPLQPALVMVPCGSVHNNVITHTLLHPSFHPSIFLSHHSTFITAPSFFVLSSFISLSLMHVFSSTLLIFPYLHHSREAASVAALPAALSGREEVLTSPPPPSHRPP